MSRHNRTFFFAVWAAVVLDGCATLQRSPVADNVVAARQMSLRGLDAMQKGCWDEAEALFARAIETNAADERAHRCYAEALWRRGQQEEAVRHLEESVRLSGGDPELSVQLGQMYLARGDCDRAWQQAELAIQSQRQSASAWALRGDILRCQGNLQEAMVSYHRSLSYQPHDPHVQVALAEIYWQQNRPRRALATLASLAEQYAPGEAPQDVLFRYGLALKALGRYRDAVEVLTEASRRGEPTVELLYHLGETQFALGDAANARLSVRAALARAPNHGPSRQLKQHIEGQRQSLTAVLER